MNNRFLSAFLLVVGLIILAGCSSAPEHAVKPRSKDAKVSSKPTSSRIHEVGVVQFENFDHPRAKIYHQQGVAPMFQRLKKLGLNPVWLTPDIFYAANKNKRMTFKQIFIPFTAFAFSPSMYSGMTEYVANGGLLVSNNPLHAVDANDDSKIDRADGDRTRPEFSTVGISSPGEFQVASIKPLMECPITTGMLIDENIKLDKPVWSRYVRKCDAVVLVAASGQKKKMAIKNAPFLTYNHLGKGACVYMGMSFNVRNKHIQRLFKNTFSEQTLSWLTAGVY